MKREFHHVLQPINRSLNWPVCLLVCICLSLVINGCSASWLERTLTQPEEIAQLDKDSPFLKAHMLNGAIYILSKWYVSSDETTVSGVGRHLSAKRELIDHGKFSIEIDSVAIFETNRVQTSGSVAALAVMTGVSTVVTIACLANPKACFGSCPTFYASDYSVDQTGASERLAAEGFSWCVAPPLEASDVDHLYFAQPTNGKLTLRLTNEALETHVIRHADLLAVPREAGRQLFVQGQDTFWKTNQPIAPIAAFDSQRDILSEISTIDGIERLSLADSTDLSQRETLELTFNIESEGEYGITLACRQSLLTTFLMYQTLSYMGTTTAQWLATLSRGARSLDIPGPSFMSELGGIEVLALNAQSEWEERGVVHEVGPLATDIHLQPIGKLSPGTTKIRIRATKGAWRFDQIALVELIEKVKPIRVQPNNVIDVADVTDAALTSDTSALSALLDSERTLVTMPGDEYSLHYTLPDQNTDYDLFLESRGYYIEWMRDEWLIDEDEARARQMVFNSRSAMRELAPQFKEYEREAEEMFWNSRFAR